MESTKPFQRSRPVGLTITFALTTIGFILLLVSNCEYVKGVKFLHGDLDDLISNIGFAVLIAAVFQWIFDTRFKEHFFEDIKSEIISSQSISFAGLLRVWPDSKTADFSDKIKQAHIIRIGVTYSDRFIKDYFNCFTEGRSGLKIFVYHSNTDDLGCANAISYNTRQSVEEIQRFGRSLKNYIAALQRKDIDIEVVALDSMPHYSFISFDDNHHYIILSTFSSRRADVPMLECAHGTFHNLLMADISEAEGWTSPVKAPAQSLVGSLKGTGSILLKKLLRN